MNKKRIYQALNFCIAMVWFVNGFFCKLLGLVPRHQQIVSQILGNQYAELFTRLIGLSEIVMAVWIVSGYKPKLNALLQIVVVATMNAIEFLLVPNLLLWGKFNAVFAFLLIVIIYYNQFYLNMKNTANAFVPQESPVCS